MASARPSRWFGRRSISRRVALSALACGALLLGASSAGASGEPPTTDDPIALTQWVNERYMRPMSLPPITLDDGIARAADAHRNYMHVNSAFSHDEILGSPGFTGARPSERCEALGVGPCNSEIITTSPSLRQSLSMWFDSPSHVSLLLRAEVAGFANGPGGSVGKLRVRGADGALTHTAPLNTPHSPIRVWPANGTEGVPLKFGELSHARTWRERNPLAGYKGDPNNVGPMLYLMRAKPASVELELTDSESRNVPLYGGYDGHGTATATLRFGNGIAGHMQRHVLDEVDTFMPATTLRPGERYTLTVRSYLCFAGSDDARTYPEVSRCSADELVRSDSVSFTTADAPPPRPDPQPPLATQPAPGSSVPAPSRGVQAPKPPVGALVCSVPKRPKSLRLTPTGRQLQINQRISIAAVRRVNALANPNTSTPRANAKGRARAISPTTRQLRTNQRIAEAAYVRARALFVRAGGSGAPALKRRARTITLSAAGVGANQLTNIRTLDLLRCLARPR